MYLSATNHCCFCKRRPKCSTNSIRKPLHRKAPRARMALSEKHKATLATNQPAAQPDKTPAKPAPAPKS